MHVFRWDLDKTYLDTDIGSVRGLIRAGLQRADEKRNVPGSRTLLTNLVAHDPDTRVFVLSGSPTQMRKVLAQKLALDGIEVHEFVLKNNLRNLRRGRLHAVRDQLGYKLSELLGARTRTPADATETLFGDDSEVDALVYAAYAAVVRGDLDAAGLERILRAGRNYDDVTTSALRAAEQIQRYDAVQDVFIHVDRGVPASRFALLGAGVWPVYSWFQAALRLHARGRLTAEAAADVVVDCAEARAWGPTPVANLCQDAIRRNLLEPEALLRVFEDPRLDAHRAAVVRAAERLGSLRDPLDEAPPRYLEFLRT